MAEIHTPKEHLFISESRESRAHTFSIVQEIGPREEQQDVCNTRENSAGHHIVAVADGHGIDGFDAAEYTVRQCLDMVSTQTNINYATVFEELNASIVQKYPNSGTTMTIVHMSPEKIQTIHVGDSQARVFRDGDTFKTLTIPHRPTVGSEKKRIADQGIPLQDKRLFLPEAATYVACSRSLGYQQPSPVLPYPEIRSYARTTSDRYLIVATDGFWDIIEKKTHRRKAVEAILAEGGSPSVLSDKLLAYVKTFVLIDNITIYVEDIHLQTTI
jgi:serine/threonine protein phosphatase PrpC